MLTACPSVVKVNPEFQDMGNAVSRHIATGFIYPFSIDHFYTVNKTDYDGSGKHYSVGYNDRKNFVVTTIYIYPKSIEPQATDVNSLFALEKAVVQNFYQNSKQLDEKAFAYPNFNGLKATFLLPNQDLFGEAPAELKTGGNLSELYIMQGREYNVKFRISYFANNAAVSQPAIEEFIAKWTAANSATVY